MKTRVWMAWGLGVALAFGAAAMADPPGRPKGLTPAQHRQLVQLEQQPQHVAVQGVQATYTKDAKFDKAFTRISDDVWTVVFDVGVPTTIIILLFASSAL
jgi:hypothetical protein